MVGRPRTVGLREPNGRPKREKTLQVGSSAKWRDEYTAREARETKAVVLAQPHRRVANSATGKVTGDDHPWRESALGRFCLTHKLRRELHDSALDYANQRRWWGNAVGKPKGFENTTPRGTGEGPSDAKVRGWLAAYIAIDAMLTKKSDLHFNVFYHLVVDNIDAKPEDVKTIIESLTAVAIHMGRLSGRESAFGRSA